MNTVLEYAKAELQKYYKEVFGDVPFNIELGLFKDVSGYTFEQDKFSISINKGNGRIEGANYRSALMGVYKAFYEMGCRFIRPGKLGEKIVKRNQNDFNLNIEVTPSYDHRGITIEGANSLENIKDIIEWMPKVGLNSYFIQFRTGYEFFERWYAHSNNNLIPPQEFNQEIANKINDEICEEIKKRGIIFHGVGHGWTCESIGVASQGWRKIDDCGDEARPLLAEINGERKFFKNTPLNTHLCYSQKNVCDMLINEVANYASEHKELNVIHFWLADDFNNICECENCKKEMPADQYVRILNGIDEKLTALGITTKIVFLVYLELYWTPLKEKIKNQDRFLMMFAPIFRSYSEPYLANGELPNLENVPTLKFERNKINYPHDIKTYLKFLSNWQKCFSGDSFDFDYHLMWDIFRDYSGITLSKILYSDIIALKKMKLNGLISCQVQRSFFPLPLAMTVLSRALTDNTLSFEQIESDFFNDTYGEFAPLAREIVYCIHDNVDYDYFRDRKALNDEKCVTGFKNAIPLLTNYKDSVDKAIKNSDSEFIKESLAQLNFLMDVVIKVLPAVLAKASGKSIDDVEKLYEVAHTYINEREERFSSIIDCYYFHFIVDGFLRTGGSVNYGGI